MIKHGQRILLREGKKQQNKRGEHQPNTHIHKSLINAHITHITYQIKFWMLLIHITVGCIFHTSWEIIRELQLQRGFRHCQLIFSLLHSFSIVLLIIFVFWYVDNSFFHIPIQSLRRSVHNFCSCCVVIMRFKTRLINVVQLFLSHLSGKQNRKHRRKMAMYCCKRSRNWVRQSGYFNSLENEHLSHLQL